jgi:invasion protein IalB
MTAMSKISLQYALMLSLGLAFSTGLPAFAQDATTAAPAETASPVVGDSPSADNLSMGQEAGTPPVPLTQETAEVGQTYTLATFESWQQNCVKMADGSDPCQMYQLLKDKDNNAVAEFSMFPLPAGQKAAAGATVMVPLETLLTANLVLEIDGGKPKIYPFTFCSTPGCVSRVGFTAAEITQFKKGAKADITIVPAADPTQKVVLNLSLKGFTAALDAVSATLPK